MTVDGDLWILAAASLAAALGLGYAVSRSSGLWRIDVEAAVLRGVGVPLAVLFTRSGRALPLFGIAAASFGWTVFAGTGRSIAIAIFTTQLLSQAGAEGIKRIFRRARPDAWLVREELGFSFPSGHATTAVVFYGSWAAAVFLMPIPHALKISLAALIVVWAAGIVWSRMALGAHYPVDVIGGLLFGLAWASALWAIVLRFLGVPNA